MYEGVQSQLDGYRQQVASTGFSGEALLDVNSNAGIIRLKLNTVPPETLPVFTENLSNMLVMMLTGLNVNVKVHKNE